MFTPKAKSFLDHLLLTNNFLKDTENNGAGARSKGRKDVFTAGATRHVRLSRHCLFLGSRHARYVLHSNPRRILLQTTSKKKYEKII